MLYNMIPIHSRIFNCLIGQNSDAYIDSYCVSLYVVNKQIVYRYIGIIKDFLYSKIDRIYL